MTLTDREVASRSGMKVDDAHRVLMAIPDGWAKVAGRWVRVRQSQGYADQTEHDGDVLLVVEA